MLLRKADKPEVSKRTIQNDISTMEMEYGIRLEEDKFIGKKRIYRYYDTNYTIPEFQMDDIISDQLRRELPGLRGYSSTALRNMRKFYENWDMLDSNSASALAELQNKDNQAVVISASALAEIDIYNTLQVPLTKDFPIEDFFRVPFTHHVRIIEGTKDINARYYYIHYYRKRPGQTLTISFMEN
jgi:hypothetical protein